MTFRKSKKWGLFRFTFTGKGASVSAGVPGARVSVNSKGDIRRTVSVPGSGWYDTKKIGSLRKEEQEEQRFRSGVNTVVVNDDGFRLIGPDGKSTDLWERRLFEGVERNGKEVRLLLRISPEGLAAVDCELDSEAEAQRLEAALS
jgi:hypothetical protein